MALRGASYKNLLTDFTEVLNDNDNRLGFKCNFCDFFHRGIGMPFPHECVEPATVARGEEIRKAFELLQLATEEERQSFLVSYLPQKIQEPVEIIVASNTDAKEACGDSQLPPDTTPPPSDPNLNPPIDPVQPDGK